jgi:hypothetical protein
MRKTRVWIALACMLFAVSQALWPETRKAGLWEITTTTTLQQSPFIAGSVNGPTMGGTRTSQVCLTQEMIDKYGALLPQSRGQCHIANKAMQSGGMTADWVCSGRITGQGSLESVWSDLEHSKGKLHFVGKFQMGSEAKPIEWTTESTAAFKSSDCGSVKPMPLPESGH